MSPDRDVVAEQTVALRAEVREAHAAWQADIDNNELERDYFEKLDRLDHNLAERGLERGEHIDEEVPLREFQKEEGMTPRWPWSRSEEETYVLEIDNPNGNGKLYMSRGGMENDNVPEWDTLDKAAIADERSAHGFAQWFTPPPPGLRIVPEREAQAREDLQNVINLANEIEDRTPQEQASLDRLEGQLERDGEWLKTFAAEIEERERATDDQKGYGIGD
jgi:hypothetical protein